ncbi:MAG: hypothetical protein ACR2PK_07675, partial [Acidimicrobiales bacterium]
MSQPDPERDPADGPDSPGGDGTAVNHDAVPVLVATGVHITYRTYLDGKRGLRSRLSGAHNGGDARYKDVH